jgi:hypothetical protein
MSKDAREKFPADECVMSYPTAKASPTETLPSGALQGFESSIYEQAIAALQW